MIKRKTEKSENTTKTLHWYYNIECTKHGNSRNKLSQLYLAKYFINFLSALHTLFGFNFMIAVLLMMSLLKIKYASDIQKFKTGIFVQFFFHNLKMIYLNVWKEPDFIYNIVQVKCVNVYSSCGNRICNHLNSYCYFGTDWITFLKQQK